MIFFTSKSRWTKKTSPRLLFWLFLLLAPGNAFGVENALLSDLFTHYQTTLDAFIQAMSNGSWSQAEQQAIELTQQGKELMALGQQEKNPTWEFYASNLVHHGLELQTACQQKESVEAVYLIAILINHLGEIQSAIPVWLLEYINKQIHELEQAIVSKDLKRTRDAAEVIHDSATKIILSASTSRQIYRHTRWLTNILDLNRIGDALVGETNTDDWTSRQEQLQKIKVIHATWKDGFYPQINQSRP